MKPMNRLKGNISKVLHDGDVFVISVKVEDLDLTVVETKANNEFFNTIDCPVNVYFDNRAVILALRDSPKLSIANKFYGKITEYKRDELFTNVSLYTSAGYIESIISNQSFQELNLKIGLEVAAYVSANDLTLESL